ncbi:Initiation-specific alpha-1,6-mannosyltransferase [Talaromyces pinophilus]|nr:Initiation-specific alpha-1,6-mannosyltransferase [Talaromyces pinophilus]
MTPKTSLLFSFFLKPRRILLWFSIILALFIVQHLLSNTTTPHKIDDDNNNTKPRFLYRSHFRDNPDLEYEKRISDALQGLERTVLTENNGEILAEERIWQIARDEEQRGDDSKAFERRNRVWRYSLMTDDKATNFIDNVLSSVPEIAQIYHSYPYYVLRTDLLRYLLLWYYGGFYADMDVFPARPIKDCPDLKPVFFSNQKQAQDFGNISLVVGIELDEPYVSDKGMREWHWTRRYGFLQYTMYSPRRFSPVLREIVTRVMSHTKQHNEHVASRYLFGYSEREILGISGPDVVTDAVLDVLSATLPPTHRLMNISMEKDAGIDNLPISSVTGETLKRVTWAPFYGIDKTVCIDDDEALQKGSMGGICVLPVNAWGNGQRHSGSEGFGSERACVNHRFRGSWKKGWWESHFG